MNDRLVLILQGLGFLIFAVAMWRVAKPASQLAGRAVRGINDVAGTVFGVGPDSGGANANASSYRTWFYPIFEIFCWLWFKGGAVILVWLALVSLLAGIIG